MRVAIVEPHYDDAWLSLGGTILTRTDVTFRVVSVSRHEELNAVDRTRLLAERYEHVEAVALELRDLGWRRRDVMRTARGQGLADPRALFLADNDLDALEPLIERACEGADLVLLPMGLFHPMHEVVAQVQLGCPTATYLEYPYAYFPTCAAALAERTRGRLTLAVDVRAVAAEKRAVFEQIYPEQVHVLALPQCPVALEAVAEERLYADDARRLAWLRPGEPLP